MSSLEISLRKTQFKTGQMENTKSKYVKVLYAIISSKSMKSQFIFLSFLFFVSCTKNDLGPTDESFPVPQLLGSWDVKKIETVCAPKSTVFITEKEGWNFTAHKGANDAYQEELKAGVVLYWLKGNKIEFQDKSFYYYQFKGDTLVFTTQDLCKNIYSIKE